MWIELIFTDDLVYDGSRKEAYLSECRTVVVPHISQIVRRSFNGSTLMSVIVQIYVYPLFMTRLLL